MDFLKSSKKLLENLSGSSTKLQLVSEPFGSRFRVSILLYLRAGISQVLFEVICDSKVDALKLVESLQEAFRRPEIKVV